MGIASTVLSTLLGLAMIGSGVGTITRQERVVETLKMANTPDEWFPWLGALKVAGGLGLLLGLFVPAIGIAAGVGLALYFAGAVSFHLRADDTNFAPAAVVMVVAVVTVVLRSTTL